ncbi:MAG: AAA family ATPase, partial [Candidatus Micrarchaeaceae archaeon]
MSERAPFSPETGSFSREITSYKEGDIVGGLEFREEARRPGVYRSGDRERKSIRISESSETPRPGVLYRARILRDTNPDDPMKGEYEVEIVAAEAEPTDWPTVEENVSKAEPILRKAKRGSTEHHLKSPGEGESVSAARSRILEHSRQAAEMYETEAAELLGGDGSPEQQLVSLRRQNLVAALRKQAEFDHQTESLRQEETEILREVGDVPMGAESAALDDVRRELDNVKRAHEMLLRQSPEAYYGLHLRELKGYKEDLESGKLVEIPYVKEKIEDLQAHVLAGKPVMVYGHLGSGKTELAMHLARKYMGSEALVVSGSKDMSLAEIYGHQVLKLDKVDQAELDGTISGIEDRFK